jgi:ribosome biogenesis GTPase
VVVLSKADLAENPDASVAAVEEVALGVDVRLTSATRGDGIDALASYTVSGATVALIGPSGVGKSTLINAMRGEERQATRDVRLSDGKGRHTTVVRELITLPDGGALIDTPGLRALAMVEAEAGIAAAFPEIDELAARCRFSDCTHESEPGCAVIAAAEAGTLSAQRLESYRKLVRESRNAAIRADARLMAEERRRWIIIHKSAKKYYTDKGRG